MTEETLTSSIQRDPGKPRGAGSLAAASAERGLNLNPKDAEILLPFDTETTGLPDFKAPSDAPHQPHLVQLAAVVLHIPTRQPMDLMNVIIRPEGTLSKPAWVSDPKAIEAHGITTERAFDEGIRECDAVEQFLALWRRGQGRFAHNHGFDNRILRIAIMRYFGRDLADEWYHAPFNCTQFLASDIMQMAPTEKMKKAGFGGKPKPPKLSEAHLFFTGRELEGAHDAMNDVNGCIAVYFAIQDGITTDQTPSAVVGKEAVDPGVEHADPFAGVETL